MCDGGQAEPRQFRIHKAHIKIGIMDDELRIADEGQKIVDDLGEDRLVLKDRGGVAVDARRVLRHVALGIDENVEDIAGQALVHNLDRANFQHPMSVGRIEACRFRVEHDFTHGAFGLPLAPRLSARTERRQRASIQACRACR